MEKIVILLLVNWLSFLTCFLIFDNKLSSFLVKKILEVDNDKSKNSRINNFSK